ncbi:MAG TPA: cation:proton antiporter subunit C [Terriglobia bacterium]|nr:cation:proton antiporter subunit C [Terriglobia bacterium]
MGFLPYVITGWLFFIGLYGIVTSRNLFHLILCLGIIQSSSYILLLAIGYHVGAVAPVFSDIPTSTPAVDPIVQALALTDIVVEVTVLALLLALAVQAHKRHGTLDPNELKALRG